MPTVGSAVVSGLPAERWDWVPSRPLISTRFLELRKRVGLMITVVLLSIGIPVIALAFRLIFHAVDPKSYGPAGSPGVFTGLSEAMASFGFLAAAVLGTAAGTTDLSDGMFRHLVITGRSRLSLYLARVPAALAIIVPLVAAAFCALCLVVAFAGTPQPTAVSMNGVSIQANLSEPQLASWAAAHPRQALFALGVSPQVRDPAAIEQAVQQAMPQLYASYRSAALGDANPSMNEMAKVGLWIECEIVVGLLVGLGLGSLMGQRTVATILMIALQLVLTPLLGSEPIPYFLNGQRLLVGVALNQLKPEALTQALRPGEHVHGPFSGGIGLPPMPTWAMVSVIVAWAVVWSVLGAWRMSTRDA